MFLSILPYIISFIIIFALLIISYFSNQTLLRNKLSKNILLVIAHPDDEAMFFIPLLKSLVSSKINIHILCLSTGNYNSLGNIRKLEMYKSAELFNISKENVHVLDLPIFQDGPDSIWTPQDVANVVTRVITYNNIKTVITFDENGVSSHPNHISVYHGVLFANKDDNSFKVYVLKTLPLLVKYSSFMSIYSTLFNSDLLITSLEPWYSYNAMKAHASQFVWFRHLFVWFSSYTFVNSFELIKPTSQ